MTTLTAIVRTCGSYPAQFSALTDDDRVVYIRYRSGIGRIHIGPKFDRTWPRELVLRVLPDLIDAAIGEPPVHAWLGKDKQGGTLTDDELRDVLEKAGIKLAATAIPRGESGDLLADLDVPVAIEERERRGRGGR